MPKRYALCTGINDFTGIGSDLAGCVNDAHGWGAAFQAAGYDEVRYLIDQEATRDAWTAAVEDILGKAKWRDTVSLQNSTHGSEVRNLNTGPDDPEVMDQVIVFADLKYLRDDHFAELLQRRRFGVHINLYMDLCYSGSIHRFAGGSRPTGGKPRFIHPDLLDNTPPLEPRRSRVLFPRPQPLLISGCKDSEVAWDGTDPETGKPGGAFTVTALAALRHEPTTNQRWFDAVRRPYGGLPNDEYEQSPQMTGTARQRSRAPLT